MKTPSLLPVLLLGLSSSPLLGQTPGADPTSAVLVAFDLRTEPEADLDESVEHTKTAVLHPQVDLRSGLKLGMVQKAAFSPGLSARGSTVTWAFYGAGNGSGSGDDKAAVSLAAAIENNLYFSFTISPKPGYGLNLSSSTLTLAYSFVSGGRTSGPTHTAVLSSATGFSEDQALGINNDVNNKVATYELSHPGLTTITSPVEFRIYCWRPDGNAGEGTGLALRQNPGMPLGEGGNVVLSGEVFKLSGE